MHFAFTGFDFVQFGLPIVIDGLRGGRQFVVDVAHFNDSRVVNHLVLRVNDQTMWFGRVHGRIDL